MDDSLKNAAGIVIDVGYAFNDIIHRWKLEDIQMIKSKLGKPVVVKGIMC